MKLFVFSDAHSFYTPLKEALDKAGFDPNNEEHWLISCGDVFDRGPESEEILHYLMSIERKILIKGNHDTLLQECCEREYFYNHDFSNGTVRTINDIGGAGMGFTFDDCCRRTYNKLARYRELLVNYYETQNYIFVHSWIPCKLTERVHPADKWITLYDDSYMEDWRNASQTEWDEAMWGNPFELWKQELNKTGKTIVFGHWHCSAGHAMISEIKISENESECAISEFEDDAIWEPCYAEGIIGIDRCTVHTGEVNVLVLEDEFLV